MSKIVLIAPGDQIAQLGHNLKNKLKNPNEMTVIEACMDEAVKVAKELENQDVDVIISRGESANMIKASISKIPVVEISITDVDIMSSINSAREKIKKESISIGYVGFEKTISQIRTFLDTFNLEIHIYEIKSMKDIEIQMMKAVKDNVDIIVSGYLACQVAEKAGMPHALLQSSEASVEEAYKKAKEIQNAVYMEKRKLKEINAILNSVSEAIISIDEFQNITTFNKVAEKFIGCKAIEAIGKPIGEVCKQIDDKLLSKPMTEGKEAAGKVVEIKGKVFAVNVTPVIMGKKVSNMIITLEEVSELQNKEIKVRKNLYLKGNVAKYNFYDIKGVSEEIKETIEAAKSFAQLESNILIIGETGIGKELFAQSIHNLSSRKEGPFVAVNCGAIPASLINSEFFGYVEGAFTGSAKGGKIGYFELAHNGTIFLDEISEMDLYGQVTLLRAIQERQIRRVGGENLIPINVRIIAAANKNLYAMVKEDKFRRDLFYRLSVLMLNVPPLRERKKDISYLAAFFVDHYRELFKKEVSLSSDALDEFESFDWDGNVRQLKNFCERIVAITNNNIIDGNFIRKQIKNSFYIKDPLETVEPASKESSVVEDIKFVINKRVIYASTIMKLMEKYNGNRELIAEELQISKSTLYRYIKSIQNKG